MIILVQGAPCTGKSLLCERLSEEFGFEHLSKDHVTEALFDAGVGENAAKASNAMLMRRIGNVPEGEVLIVETNLNRQTGERELSDAIDGKHTVFEIFLTAPADIILERFVKRWESGVRHPSHKDGEKIGDLKTYLESDSQPIGQGEVLVLQGDKPPDVVFALAREAVEAALER